MKDTKNEIVKVAKEMFMLKGYDNTSTKDIIDKVKIAKGTLYYHFKSKKEIMDHILNETLETLILDAKRVVKNKKYDVITRIIMLFEKLSLMNENEYLLNHMHKVENIKLNYYQNKLIIKKITPILSDLIKEGIKQKVFNVNYPYELSELIIIYITEAFDYNLKLTKKQEKNKIIAFIDNFEKMLGVNKGSLMELLYDSKE